ncbi:MAG: chromosomal replication initiator protein DnaA [Chthoniobacterales bacterium]
MNSSLRFPTETDSSRKKEPETAQTNPNALLWDRLSSVIRNRVSADSFDRWFSGVAVLSISPDSVTLGVPNPIHQFFIESNYSALLSSALEEVLGQSCTLLLDCPENCREQGMEAESPEECRKPEQTPADKGGRLSPPSSTAAGMNPSYTFGSFIVGANNQFAHAASQAVANSPARTYNPLFIYGGSGLGKTHLLQSIGHHILSVKKNARVVYLRSEQFTNEFIDAIQNNALVAFRKRYRQADILMIDDIQFFAGKERSQEEFFHTFGALHDGHKQIILSSDRPASEIANLEQRLVSRFEWGMTAEIQPPDMETRIAILQGKASRMHIEIEQWVLEFLADKIRSDIRRLEGALMRVAAYKSLSGQPLTNDALEHLLRDVLQEQARKAVTIDQIQKKVAEHFDIRLADMTSKRRQASIAYPRQIAMYLSREMTPSTLIEIGDAFGGKDHGTVIHACKLVKKRMEEDPKARHLVRLLDQQLQR